MWRSRVLLPLPLPPITIKMSLWFTVKFRSFISTKFPNAIVRSLTVIGGGPSGDVIFRRGAAFGACLPLVVLLGGIDAFVVAISELMLEFSLDGSFKFRAR